MSNEQIIIDKILAKYPNGIKACDIANELSTTRKDVNRFLYSHLDRYWIDDNYKWYLKESFDIIDCDDPISYEEADPILAKLNNRKGAKEYRLEDFMNLANWEECSSHCIDDRKKYVTNKNGFRIQIDSKPEEEIINYLDESDAIVAFGGQQLLITYGSKKEFWPDFIAYTKDKHIAVIEAKPVSWMSYFKNIKKYKRMTEFCQNKGYEYMMLDFETQMSFEDFKNMKVDSEFEKYFQSLYDNGYIDHFDITDVKEWHDLFKKNIKRIMDFYLQVGALIIRYGMYNYARYANNFDVYKTRQSPKHKPKI